MSREAMRQFLPATTVMLEKYVPGGIDYIFPDWVLKQCPTQSIELTIPGGTRITLRWPLLALVIVLGIVQGWATGAPLLNRALRKNQTRPGLFTWSFSFLLYAVMSLAGLFFHCFHVDQGFHLVDIIATGSASISIMAGFGAFFGIVDDRTLLQRCTLLLTYLVLAGVAVMGPDLLQEQLYLGPVFLAAIVGFRVITKCALEAGRSGVSSVQQAGFSGAKNWLLLAAVGLFMALASLPADRWCCVYLGAHLNIQFWVFVGSNLSMWGIYKFVLTVFNKNIHFTDLKRQRTIPSSW